MACLNYKLNNNGDLLLKKKDEIWQKVKQTAGHFTLAFSNVVPHSERIIDFSIPAECVWHL